RADRRGHRAHQHGAAGSPAHPPLRQPPQGVRSGRRRSDAHPQAAPQRHRRALQGDHRRHLRRRRRDRVRSTDHLRDRRVRRAQADPGDPRPGRGGGLTMAYFLELLINGALTGLMYSLVALGIVLIYKSAGVPNLAQGAMVMLGAYATWSLVSYAGMPVYLAMLIAAVLMFGFGLLAERLLLRRMVGQPIIMIVMLTLGLEI